MSLLYMKYIPTRITPIAVSFFACLFTLPGWAANADDIVEGIYELTSRELPDGTVQKPPQIMGSLTMWKGQRNVNVLSTNSSGKKFSFSLVSKYTLTNTEFTEAVGFRIITDETSGEPPKYLVSGPAKSVSVKVQGNSVSFKPPFTRPSLVFDEKGLVSTVEDESVDTWRKVK